MTSRVYQDNWEVDAASVEPVPFSADGDPSPTYPLHRLKLTGSDAKLRLPILVLENEALVAKICPMLGGRIVEFAGKATGGTIVGLPERITPEASGMRALSLRHGIQTSQFPDLDSMSSFDYLVHEPVSDDGPAAVMLYGASAGSRTSLQVVYSLLPGASALNVEARVFNRSLEQRPLRVSVAYSQKTFSEGACVDDVATDSFIAPRDSVAFPFLISVGGIEIDQSTYGSVEDILRRPSAPVESLPIHLRGAGHVRAAQTATRQGDLRLALDHLDSALTTLADDPLTWWHRAVISRLLGERDEDSPELATAHALSPLEPVLKAEAFLSMPQTHGREPNPLLAPLAADPDAMHECVHLYAEANLFQEASRLIDEAQRHRESSQLRYINAWMLLTHSRMEIEAANEVATAGKTPLEPPFPWRPLETEAVRVLSTRFPKDDRLQQLNALVVKNSGPP